MIIIIIINMTIRRSTWSGDPREAKDEPSSRHKNSRQTNGNGNIPIST